MARAFHYYIEVADLDHAIGVATHPVLPSWTLSQTEFGDIVSQALELVDSDSPAEGHLLATNVVAFGSSRRRLRRSPERPRPGSGNRRAIW